MGKSQIINENLQPVNNTYLYNALVQIVDNEKLPYLRLIIKLHLARLKQSYNFHLRL